MTGKAATGKAAKAPAPTKTPVAARTKVKAAPAAPTRPAAKGEARKDATRAVAVRKAPVKAAPAKPAKATASAARPAKGPGRKQAGKTTRRPLKGGRGRKPMAAKQPPVRSVKIRELDPLAKCGAGTSVQFLYRVDELLDGAPTAHLVFFDRHGWYCEHGRNCPAVTDVRKHGKKHHLFTD